MKTTIAYEVFFYFESKYFWRLFNFEFLVLEIYSKYNLQAIYEMVFYILVLQF